jgi:hypothetical protein
MLRELARDTGLVDRVSQALADTYAGPWQHAPGQVFADMAVAIVDGGDCVSHIEVFGDQHDVCGPVASMPTTWRMLDRIDAAHLPGVLAARAAARERAWAAGAGPDLGGLLQIDFDATVTISHSEDKENAAKTWKRTYGFHPLLAFLDRPEVSGGEALAGLLRPGNAGSVRHEVAQVSGYTDWRFDGCRRCSPGQCPRPVPALTCVAGNGGVRSSEKKPKGFRSVRKPQARGRPDG